MGWVYCSNFSDVVNTDLLMALADGLAELSAATAAIKYGSAANLTASNEANGGVPQLL